VTVRIIGDPIPVVNKIFEAKDDSKDARFTISISNLVEDEIECRLKEYIYRNEADAPQDISLVFDVIGTNSISSKISEFLYKKLSGFKNISIIIGKQETHVEQNLIRKLLKKQESETR
jgi:hypothetical protein